MNTDIQKNQTFEEKMKARVKDSIGDLISDEDLSKIVKRGVEEAFFKPKIVPDGYRTRQEDPLIVAILKDLLQKEVQKAVNNWLKRNPEEIKKSMDKVIENGVGVAVLNSLSNKFQSELFTFQTNIENKINNGF